MERLAFLKADCSRCDTQGSAVGTGDIYDTLGGSFAGSGSDFSIADGFGGDDAMINSGYLFVGGSPLDIRGSTACFNSRDVAYFERQGNRRKG